MQDKISQLIHSAIDLKIFPGATVLIGNGASIEYLKSFGTTLYENAGSKTVTPDMIYDIASITKVFTGSAIFKLIDQKRISLETKIGDIVPGLEPEEKKNITIKQLLTHSSGLSLKFHSLSDFPSKQIRHHLLTDQLINNPGEKILYDNANGMMLAEVVTCVSESKFVDYLRCEILQPLGLEDTMFNPGKEFLSRIVPAGSCDWRMRMIHGAVHDSSAFAMGGIAGHAGLFSTATDLWKFGTMWLSEGIFKREQILSKSIVDQAIKPQVQSVHGSIGLEWVVDNKRLSGNAPIGTFGHSGFTGTSIVISPSKQTIIVFLSNWIYPDAKRDNSLIFDVRRSLSETILA